MIILDLIARTASTRLNRQLLDKQGRIRLLPAAFYATLDPTELRAWLHFSARYFIPTTESVALVKQLIAGRKAIEIGSGNGDLYHHLGIFGTDAHLHLNPAARAFYEQTNQPMTHPPKDVANFEALAAIRHYQPTVVIGAWVTHKWQPGMENGSDYGVQEEQIIQHCTYIFIGNDSAHASKPILQLPHQRIEHPGLRSRATTKGKDFIGIWQPTIA
jgi:hypothetical protein